MPRGAHLAVAWDQGPSLPQSQGPTEGERCVPGASWPPPPRLKGPKRLHHKERHSVLVRLPLETDISSWKACLLPGQTGERCHPPTPTDCLGRESVTRPGSVLLPEPPGPSSHLPVGGGLSHSLHKRDCAPPTQLCFALHGALTSWEGKTTPAKCVTRAKPAAGHPHDPRGAGCCHPTSRVRPAEGTEIERLTVVLRGVPNPSRVGPVHPGREGQQGRGSRPGPEPMWSLVADRFPSVGRLPPGLRGSGTQEQSCPVDGRQLSHH